LLKSFKRAILASNPPGIWRISVYIMGCGILGIIAAALLTDYTNRDISQEYDAAQAGRRPAG